MESSLLTLLVVPVVLLSPLSPSSSCSYMSTRSGMVLACTGLNTTADILDEKDNTAESVVRLEISDSVLDCVQFSHFCRFHHLEEIKVRKSVLKQGICSHQKRHKKTTQCLKSLRSLDLSSNRISRLGSSTASLHSLERIDLSHNNLHQLDIVFSTLTNLKYLNLSNNLLSEDLKPKTFKSLPTSIEELDLTGNLMSCSPSLSWLSPWSLSLSPSLLHQLSKVKCKVMNSHQMAPLLQVMQYYTSEVNPSCPHKCLCYIYHFTPSSYTVLVNCSMQGLTTFPTVPLHTTILDLSHNNLSDLAYSSLDIPTQHYSDLAGLVLSHNLLTQIHTKLSKLRLYRMFKADHNQMSSIPYHFSLHLQSYPSNKLTLGHNPWICTCNAEITSLVTNILQL